MEASKPTAKRSRFISILLWLLPAWLILSAGVGIYLLLRHEKQEQEKETPKLVTKISASSLADDWNKLENWIGPRNTAINDGLGLVRAAAWIEGTLGPSNTGYNFKRLFIEGGQPILLTSLKRKRSSAPAIWLVVGYDTPISTESKELTDANASLLAQIHAAQALAGDSLSRDIHFAFVPYTGAGPQANPVAEKLLSFIRENGPLACILTLEKMSDGAMLALTTSGPNNPQLQTAGKVPGVSSAFGTEGFPAKLAAEGFPVIRIETIPSNASHLHESLPAASHALVELIRRLDQEK